MKTFKKLLVTLLIAVMGIGIADAQFRFGIKAGVNVNHLSFKDNPIKDGNNRAGWTAGIMGEFQVPIIGICVDASLMYARLNAAEDNKNFLMVPLNLKYKLSLPIVGKIIAPYIFTGPSFDFKLDKNAANAIFKTKTFQAVWNVGLGLELVRHLQIGASYGFGINNIAEKVANANTINLHNNYWTISAAYLF